MVQMNRHDSSHHLLPPLQQQRTPKLYLIKRVQAMQELRKFEPGQLSLVGQTVTKSCEQKGCNVSHMHQNMLP